MADMEVHNNRVKRASFLCLFFCFCITTEHGVGENGEDELYAPNF